MTVVVAPVPQALAAPRIPVRLYANLELRQIPALNGMRAFAVFAVMAYHFGFSNVPGGYGVVAFFVLSGFLITWLLLKEHARAGRISLRHFYIRRSLRIFPAFYAYTFLLVLALFVTGREVPWGHAISALAYVSNYYNAVLGDPNTGFSHTWSLAIEEQFYLIWPAAFLFLVRKPARMAGRLALVIGAVWLYRGFLVYGLGVDQAYLYAAFDTRFDALLVGCTLAVLLHQRRAERAFYWLTCHPMLPLLTMGGVAFLVLDLPFTIPRQRDILGFALAPVLLGIFMVQVIGLQRSRWWSWFEHPIMGFLGRISYPLYLYQQITLHPVRDRLTGLPVSAQFLAACAVTVAVASLSFYLIEQPLLRLKDRFGAAPLPRNSHVSADPPHSGGLPVLSGGMS